MVFRLKANIVDNNGNSGSLTVEAQSFLDLRKEKHRLRTEQMLIQHVQSENINVNCIDILEIDRIA